MSEKKTGAAKSKVRFFGFWLALGALAAFDTFVMSQGILSLMLGAPFFIVLLIMTVRSAFTDPDLTGRRAALSGLGMSVVLVLLFYVPLNNILARHRAEKLIAACKQYREKRGELPAKLEDLVPEYIPRVPRAKYTPIYGEFRYNGATLMWISIPPFGRPYYDFYSDKWKYLD